MKRILSTLLVLSTLICSFMFVTTEAASERGEMLMRTTDLDTSWKSVKAGESLNVIGSDHEGVQGGGWVNEGSNVTAILSKKTAYIPFIPVLI